MDITPYPRVQVSKSAGMHHTLTSMYVKDKDSGNNGNYGVDCNLDNEQFEAVFVYEDQFGKMYAIRTSAFFIGKERDQYEVQVMCQDNGSPPIGSSKMLEILVTG